MGSPLGPAHVIANPRSGRGTVAQAWPAVERALRDGEIEHSVAFTDGPGHATALAREAVDAGARFVVAMGGDGTVHEVVNGLMGEDGPRAPELILGVLASGTGCDFARTFGIPRAPLEAARHLLGADTWGRLDLGRVRYRAHDGTERARWFANIAEAGIGADVVASAARMPAWLGGRAYRLAALRGILRFRPREARVGMHGRRARAKKDAPLEPLEHRGTVTMVVVANCQFFGGGLRVAPRAIPSDAMLDVLVGEGSKWDAVRALRAMPRGEHVPDPTIAEYLAARVDLSGPGPLNVEADGEVLGTTPATFEVVPSMLTLKI